MRLHEYQSKNIYKKYGITVPQGRIANSPQEARDIREELGGQVIIKAQVLVGGRGKAGGIRLARSSQETEELATQIFAMSLNSLPVRKILVEEAVSISSEIYIAITNDRQKQAPVLIASGSGGMEIEEIAHKSPEKIFKLVIDPLLGLMGYQIREIMVDIDLPVEYWKPFTEIVNALWKVFVENDASLVEINPMAITADNRIVALDAKVIIDDNSLFRHPDLVDLRDLDAEDPSEILGRKFGVSFIRMEGEIGCLVNGAGLAMATMDVIQQFGGRAANFLDIGGGASSEKVGAALKLILSDPKVKVILINVFGGITRCDEVARGILNACNEIKITQPVVVRLVGTNEEEGKNILVGTKLIYVDSLVAGVQKAISLAQEQAK